MPIKELYLLDPDIIFLNHGSFGATPRPVLRAYQNWQTRLERQPVKFLGRELWDELKQSRQILGNYLNANADDLVYIPNTTFSGNVVGRVANTLGYCLILLKESCVTAYLPKGFVH